MWIGDFGGLAPSDQFRIDLAQRSEAEDFVGAVIEHAFDRSHGLWRIAGAFGKNCRPSPFMFLLDPTAQSKSAWCPVNSRLPVNSPPSTGS